MHAKVKAHPDYQVIEEELNDIELLRVIKLSCFNNEDENYAPQKVHETKAAFYALKQRRDSDQALQINFMNTVKVGRSNLEQLHGLRMQRQTPSSSR
jgi:hypothetical protein